MNLCRLHLTACEAIHTGACICLLGSNLVQLQQRRSRHPVRRRQQGCFCEQRRVVAALRNMYRIC